MSEIPGELRYTKSHEWVRQEEDGTCTVGVTDHAQSMLGDFVYIELPVVDDEVTAGEACCTVESVKAASDVNAPLSGKVIAVNADLDTSPETVNSDPYGKGWVFKMQPAAPEAFNELLDAEAYQKVEEEA